MASNSTTDAAKSTLPPAPGSKTARQALDDARRRRLEQGHRVVPAQRVEDLRLAPVFERSAEELREIAQRFPELVSIATLQLLSNQR